ncbi:MAG: twin-arginine translocation signal domain-containing protein [Ignavibacteria bacterium]|jgi:TldD protein|nr:twin-arginine translocation signal domain-containing protein [Ignavibacteria bacterium]MCU7504443.1 twin-arginine translocation signal domain-containing protein [Ignavibacteria bacterium]MCU7517466.1 twin-arginine translocation signal domain-containing protein [Ignavibacteria bacterium]
MSDNFSGISRRDFLKITGTLAVGATLANPMLNRVFAGQSSLGRTSSCEFFKTLCGLDNTAINKLLGIALSKGGDYADLFADYSINNSIILEDRIIKNASRNISAGIGIRVLKGDQTGYAYSEDMTFESLKNAALTAANIANETGKSISLNVTNKKVKNYYEVSLPVSEVELDAKIKLLKESEEAAFLKDKRVIKVSANMLDSERYIVVANSENLLMEDYQPLMRYNVSVIVEEDGKRQSGRMSGGGRLGMEYFSKIKTPEKFAHEAVDQALLLLTAKNAPAGPMPVVLSPGDSGILLHEAIGHPLEADFNRKGTSAYSGRIGQKVASELCTVYDGGTVPNDRGSINFDDEAVASNKTTLIENGILKDYMHDRISAKYYKVKQTGNGRRESYKYFPIPRMTVTYLENGTSDPTEIISSIKKGVYCKNFSGGQVDISNGDFVFNPTLAFMIEDGKITYPVKNFTLIGNGPEVLTKVTMVGNDFKFSDGMWTCGKGQSVPVGVGLPTVKVSEITVGGM